MFTFVMSRNPWYGVDLDGTLAHYSSFEEQGEEIGAPIEPIATIVETLLSHGRDVKIFTARIAYDADHQRKLIEAYTKKLFGRALPATNQKDYGMITCLDDRATQVVANEGIIVQDLVPIELRKLYKLGL